MHTKEYEYNSDDATEVTYCGLNILSIFTVVACIYLGRNNSWHSRGRGAITLFMYGAIRSLTDYIIGI